MKPKDREELLKTIETNKKQAEFYDNISRKEDEALFTGYARNESANFATRVWARLRYAHQDAFEDIGVDEVKTNFLLDQCAEKRGGKFLEIGCFRGTRYSDPIISLAGSYTGIDLSHSAIAAFENQINGSERANKINLVAGDLLTHRPTQKYDVIFAHGVLHHFESPGILFQHLSELMAPNGLLLFAEPSQVNKLFKFVRSVYRPFQSDKEWEWPFTEQTVEYLNDYFVVEKGFGWGRHSMPLSLAHAVPLLGSLLKPLYHRVLQIELSTPLSAGVWKNSTVVLSCRRK